jgi:hypothetical protein
MKTIRISDEVYAEIYKMGKMGDTPDSVLRRVFNILDDEGGGEGRSKTGRARKKLSAKVAEGEFIIEFVDGVSNRWPLPNREDKLGIRKVRNEAVDFAKENGASHGQLVAVRKALTEAGYHLTK